MNKKLSLHSLVPGLDDLIRSALAEDIGKGDVTTQAVVPRGRRARAGIKAKQDLVLCGIEVCRRVFLLRDRKVRFTAKSRDGRAVKAGKVIAVVEGPAKSLLECERLALNFLQQLSGISTLTSRYVSETKGFRARIMATRKTHPCLRGLEKYAVITGGALAHRLRLDDGILIKDNHIAAAGGLKRAVGNASRARPGGMMIEVEVESLGQLKEALAAGADIIMLDNMSPALMKKAVGLVKGRALLEASGGVSLADVGKIAACGVDFISVGALTHSAPAADISMEVEPIEK